MVSRWNFNRSRASIVVISDFLIKLLNEIVQCYRCLTLLRLTNAFGNQPGIPGVIAIGSICWINVENLRERTFQIGRLNLY